MANSNHIPHSRSNSLSSEYSSYSTSFMINNKYPPSLQCKGCSHNKGGNLNNCDGKTRERKMSPSKIHKNGLQIKTQKKTGRGNECQTLSLWLKLLFLFSIYFIWDYLEREELLNSHWFRQYYPLNQRRGRVRILYHPLSIGSGPIKSRNAMIPYM